MNITHISFEKHDQNDDAHVSFAVIVARFENKWVFVKHKQRLTFEIPGGRREPGEPIIQTAKRELYEETGAQQFDLQVIDVYRVHFANGTSSCGLLCYATITVVEDLPELEIEAVHFFDTIPQEDKLTYPKIQPHLFEYIAKVGTCTKN